MLLNVILTGIAWFNLAAMGEGYDYDPSYRVWSIVFPLFIVAVILQVISIILLFKVPKAGRIIAGIGSFIMIPVGMVFFMGYMASYEKNTNQGMATFSSEESATEDNAKESIDVKLLFKTTPFFVNGVLFMILGAGVMIMGVGTGGIVVGAGLLALVNSIRLNNRIVIGLAKNDLIIMPGIYSETCRVPLNNVTVKHMDKRVYKLHIQTPEVDKHCIVRRAWLEG